MSAIVKINPPVMGWWPQGQFPQTIVFDGSAWERTPRLLQIEGWLNGSLIHGYREDVAGLGRSRHLYVYEDEQGRQWYEIRHRESHPKHHPLHHAVEVAREHPLLALGAVIALGWGISKLRAA